ncbi:hypothetical protein TCDM_02968 [Trypanosoma cruzi Dm28c]|uniref:Uncharacterized protein n=1 Tax=Trypanosoma cruzi Dm28c TaxID=1416333 RepID=V5BPW9_TRYCR|nr:hypothetical protein TCDM_02968 [Trypanosoma cruzi Dm28c]
MSCPWSHSRWITATFLFNCFLPPALLLCAEGSARRGGAEEVMSTYDDSFEGSDTSLSPSPRSSLRDESDAAVILPQPSASSVPIPVPVEQELPEATNSPVQALPGDTLADRADAAAPTPPVANTAAAAVADPLLASPASVSSLSQRELKSPVVGGAAPASADKASVDTNLSHIEVKLGGLNAPSTAKFKALSSYVAFGATPPGSTSVLSATINETRRESQNSVAAEVKEKKFPTETPAVILPIASESDGSFSRRESSVFSTLSQHLTKRQSREGESNSEKLRKESAATAVAATHPLVEEKKDEGADGVGLAMAPLPLPQAGESQMQSNVPISFSAPSTDFPGVQSNPFGVEGALASLPPPLPSRDPRQDPKIVELRETSEAVERLVRAFALLRGHVAAPSSDPLADAKDFYATKDTEKLSSLRLQRGVGDAGTLRVSQSSSRRPFLPRSKPVGESRDANEKVALQMSEAAVEEAIMCLVMELMQSDARQPFEENTGRKFIHPSLEFVGMDNFNLFPPSKQRKFPRSLQKIDTPFSVFDGGMQAFAPGDPDASESLFHSVFQGLQKYVWSHVAATDRHTTNRFPPVSAHFAWALQLDLLLVCMQTLEGRFAGERAGTKDGSAVWIQYEGSREAEPLARNAAHCLPFEVLDAKQRDKTVFRLEYWVTKDKMWTVLEALVASIREGIVSRSDGYRAFSSDEEIHIDPSALLPTRVPLFSLVPQERLGVAHDDERNGIRKEAAQKGQEESRSNFFHIHPNTMESLAHAVSTAGTELLESDRRISGKNYRQSYQDATTAVAEAVCELLDDAGIRAAIQRRAKAKIAALSERREMDNNLSRQEKERFLIETAEAEAERVVRRILHEIRVDEARDA